MKVVVGHGDPSNSTPRCIYTRFVGLFQSAADDQVDLVPRLKHEEKRCRVSGAQTSSCGFSTTRGDFNCQHVAHNFVLLHFRLYQ